MARVTVEDCLDHMDNRFQLVLVATRRTRQLMAGAESMVPRENDKPTVLALREIADGLVDASILDEKEEKVSLFEEPEETVDAAAPDSGNPDEAEGLAVTDAGASDADRSAEDKTAT